MGMVGGGWRHQTVVKGCGHTAEWTEAREMESRENTIAKHHWGNKQAKIVTGTGNGFYWRTNQGGRFSGAQFRFGLDSY